MNTVEERAFRWSFRTIADLSAKQTEEQQREKTCCKNAQQDQSGGVKKVSVRQDRDDRIAHRVKDPVIVAEQDLMEQYKTKIPVQSDKRADDQHKERRKCW